MRTFAIIGGGISGLAALHYIKKRFGDEVQVTLYERNADVGGSIASQETQGFFFETGPNGFLTNQPNTLAFIEELGLSDQLIEANADAKRRYIQLAGKLHMLPTDPVSFIRTPLLRTREKIHLIQGLFNRNISKEQSVYDYTSKRFGVAVTNRLVDPFLTGIYAGDIKRLHMGYAFPKMATPKGQPKAKMCSFKKGMGSLIAQLYSRYRKDIQTGVEIKSLDQIKADTIICAAPAYVAAGLLNMDVLNRMYYAPIAVAGLLIKKNSFKTLPDGFGYLVPSTEGKEILGVLIESNVFVRQPDSDSIFIRVMMGGAHHPAFARFSESEVLSKAIAEIDQVYGLTSQPIRTSVKLWAKGIPQYDMDYPLIRQAIKEQLAQRPSLRLCANYLDGISFNDCINNAQEMVRHL